MWEGGRTGQQSADRGVPPIGGRGRLLAPSHQVRGGGEELVENGKAPTTLCQLGMKFKGGQVKA